MRSSILAPAIALVLWSFVMLIWLYATRIPALRMNRIAYDPERPAEEFHAQLPARVRWKADNYNHLMEQPTVFYAVALSLALLGQGGGTNATLAWVYVGIRVVHSFIQATFNKIEVRFAVFVLSSLLLIALTVNAARAVF